MSHQGGRLFPLLQARFLRGTIVSMIDQSLLSALSFCIALVLIRLGSKLEYGLYVQLFAVLMLSMNLQNASINTPLIALGPKRSPEQMNLLVTHLLWLQFVVVLFLMMLASAVLWVIVLGYDVPGLDTGLILPFASWLGASWLREYMRGYRFLQHTPHRVLLLDSVYAAMVLSGLGWFWMQGATSLELLLWILAAANLVSGLVSYSRSRLTALPEWGKLGESLRDTWELARWGLPGVIVSWGIVNTYVYIASSIEGTEAAAEIAAARLLMMPVGMLLVAWTRVYQPLASLWLSQQGMDKVLHAAKLSVLMLLGIGLVYLTCLMYGYEMLEQYVLGSDYAGLEPVVLLWGGYFMLSTVRLSGTAILIAAGKFKWMFYYALIGLLLLIPIALVLTLQLGIAGTVLGMSVVEAILIVLLYRHGVYTLRKEHGH